MKTAPDDVAKTDDLPRGDMDEPPGTILIGSMNKRAYLHISQTGERMKIERANAARHGVQDIRDFVFILDGERVVLTYQQLRERLIRTPL